MSVAVARRGWVETVAIVLLLVGGFVGGFGWLIGVVVFWLSEPWTTFDKLLGTLVVPGGLALAPFVFAVFAIDTTRPPLYEAVLFAVLVFLLVAAPIMTAVHLARTSR